MRPSFAILLAAVTLTACGGVGFTSVLIRVPFSPQAPTGDWGAPYQEACEEMALIMAVHYDRQQPLSREDADEELRALVAWEAEHGYDEDVTMAELFQIARNYYGFDGVLDTEVTTERIRQYLATGRPVIVPAAGRALGNPYFSGRGPWYHALVIVGYAGETFITNDPGTKRGKGYRYAADVLLNAIHDWTGVKEEIVNGKKVMLILRP